MYSGITGQEFAADIYIGVVYYQRLRHMVLDKFQVRTTGPVDPITRQPVKVRMTNLFQSSYSNVPLIYLLTSHRAVNELEAFGSVKWSVMHSSHTERRSSSKTD